MVGLCIMSKKGGGSRVPCMVGLCIMSKKGGVVFHVW